MTGAAALVTNPPYGRDHHRIAEAFLRLLRGGSIRFAALLVPHQFDAAGRRGHLFKDPLCALRIVMPPTFTPRSSATQDDMAQRANAKPKREDSSATRSRGTLLRYAGAGARVSDEPMNGK